MGAKHMMWEEVLKKKKAGKATATHNSKGEKKDRCAKLADKKYGLKSSAYKSGYIVQCRRGKVSKVKKCSACEEHDNISKDWVSCSSCTDDKKGTEPCGRKDASKGTKRRCRPTCSACKDYKRRGGKPKKRRAGTFSKEKDKGLHGWFERRG